MIERTPFVGGDFIKIQPKNWIHLIIIGENISQFPKRTQWNFKKRRAKLFSVVRMFGDGQGSIGRNRSFGARCSCWTSNGGFEDAVYYPSEAVLQAAPIALAIARSRWDFRDRTIAHDRGSMLQFTNLGQTIARSDVNCELYHSTHELYLELQEYRVCMFTLTI